jgi:multimeric flavodoxin WrbA
MKAVIVYESMYGNTRAIAEAIGEGLRPAADVSVVSVTGATPDLLRQADLIVVGGPTHVHSMSRPATRKSAIDEAGKAGSRLVLEPGADGPGVRDWLASLGQLSGAAAAFDTRMNGPVVFTGQASKGISSLLRRHGLTVVAGPESFLVTKGNELHQGQAARAREWGASLAARAGGIASSVSPTRLALREQH